MKTKLILALAFFAQISLGISAKNEKSELLQMERDNLQIVVDSLVKRVEADSLKMDSIQIRIEKYNVTVDSLHKTIVMLMHQQEKFQSQVDSFVAEKNNTDTCMIVLANYRLKEKFDEEKLRPLLSYFGKRKAEEFPYSTVLILLRNYESYYQELNSILRDIQNDSDRKYLSFKDDFQSRYIRQIKNMKYYQKYYQQDWRIPYLDTQIEKVLKLLDTHFSNNKPIDVSRIIDDEILE